MSAISADFAVFGTSLTALLVAGLLSRQHRKTVLLVEGDGPLPGLARNIDISIGPITRPESWALLGEAVPETRRLLSRIVRRTGIERFDPILFAESPAGRDALAHIRHIATGFGHSAERLPPTALGRDLDGFALRDAVQLQAGRIEPALRRWLEHGKVQRVKAGDIGEATHVLADDAAILAHAGPLAPILNRAGRTGILTEPAPLLAAPVMLQVDAGLCLSQLPSRSIVATGPGDLEAVAPQIDALLGATPRPRWIGQSHYIVLESLDHAPVVGRLPENGPIVLAGLAPFGAFLAPAIARWLAGMAYPAEAAWFAAHAPDRALTSSSVAEYGPRTAGIAA